MSDKSTTELFDNGTLGECPCCDGHNVDVTLDYRDAWAGICHDCDWYSPPGSDCDEAIRRWNALLRRAAQADSEARLAEGIECLSLWVNGRDEHASADTVEIWLAVLRGEPLPQD